MPCTCTRPAWFVGLWTETMSWCCLCLLFVSFCFLVVSFAFRCRFGCFWFIHCNPQPTSSLLGHHNSVCFEYNSFDSYVAGLRWKRANTSGGCWTSCLNTARSCSPEISDNPCIGSWLVHVLLQLWAEERESQSVPSTINCSAADLLNAGCGTVSIISLTLNFILLGNAAEGTCLATRSASRYSRSKRGRNDACNGMVIGSKQFQVGVVPVGVGIALH